MTGDEATGTYDGVRAAQARAQARMAPAERLAWLEDALDFAARAGALQGRRAASQARADAVWRRGKEQRG